MKEIISWSRVGEPTRLAVVELCGWHNNKGHATPIGKRIAKTNWDKLSPAAKNVLSNHGITA